jgi:hypothetical protein
MPISFTAFLQFMFLDFLQFPFFAARHGKTSFREVNYSRNFVLVKSEDCHELFKVCHGM